jgi:hypothetical protein
MMAVVKDQNQAKLALASTLLYLSTQHSRVRRGREKDEGHHERIEQRSTHQKRPALK